MNESQINAWLKKEVALIAKMHPRDIREDEPLAGYGLDSLAAVKLSTELEKLLCLEIAPTISWDYPTIAQLSRHLSEEFAQKSKKGNSK